MLFLQIRSPDEDYMNQCPTISLVENGNLQHTTTATRCTWAWQHPWLRPGWTVLPARMGYCSSSKFSPTQADSICVQPHCLRVRWSPDISKCEVARRSSWTAKLSRLWLNNINSINRHSVRNHQGIKMTNGRKHIYNKWIYRSSL